MTTPVRQGPASNTEALRAVQQAQDAAARAEASAVQARKAADQALAAVSADPDTTNITTASILDAGTTGKAVLKAESPYDARVLIEAGTSSLILGIEPGMAADAGVVRPILEHLQTTVDSILELGAPNDTVMHLTGAETATGRKVFMDGVTVPSGSLPLSVIAPADLQNLILPGLMMFAFAGQPRPSQRSDVKVVWYTNVPGIPAGAFPQDIVLMGNAPGTPDLTDTFTASDNSPWDTGKWDTLLLTTDASAKIIGNAGRLDTGSSVSYSGRATVARKGSALADGEWLLTAVFPEAGNGGLQVFLRTDPATITGYYFQIQLGTGLSLGKAVNGEFSTLQNLPGVSATIGASYKLRFRIIGTVLQAKAWPTGTAEPGAWNMTATDSTITTPGSALLQAVGGSAARTLVDIDAAQFTPLTADANALTLQVIS